ncbi:uncharacterized protein BCR38DRAFT_38470 [Pseudomassariella vexata]|uniref:Uncharacterized protein n=1 Tax=Pseudomassariella vexata TaxID=1141098 RepID=A0A1Y2DR03_9PEZI|nr:uncharacterized protein BCR38DRAFT_38470 [Pseudomassariella vexata]ORY61700.1 hypothetical protein BCR38DRAFT_38470 [Pseudomassariella vexata]
MADGHQSSYGGYVPMPGYGELAHGLKGNPEAGQNLIGTARHCHIPPASVAGGRQYIGPSPVDNHLVPDNLSQQQVDDGEQRRKICGVSILQAAPNPPLPPFPMIPDLLCVESAPSDPILVPLRSNSYSLAHLPRINLSPTQHTPMQARMSNRDYAPINLNANNTPLDNYSSVRPKNLPGAGPLLEPLLSAPGRKFADHVFCDPGLHTRMNEHGRMIRCEREGHARELSKQPCRGNWNCRCGQDVYRGDHKTMACFPLLDPTVAQKNLEKVRGVLEGVPEGKKLPVPAGDMVPEWHYSKVGERVRIREEEEGEGIMAAIQWEPVQHMNIVDEEEEEAQEVMQVEEGDEDCLCRACRLLQLGRRVRSRSRTVENESKRMD